MSISDLAGNPLGAGTTGQMLGYTLPPAPEEVLPLDLYYFIIQPIRDADRTDGDLFLKRYLQGPQVEWVKTQERIFAIKNLWSITECPDEFLQYLKNIVGWTQELAHITDPLDYDTLRRLIGASVPLWRTRGPEDTIVNILRLLTAARCRIWNWFDFRWVLDETQLGEDHQGRDPWIISLPGPPDTDEYRFNVRIVDDGTLNRELVRNVVQLMRPVGERVEISYITFLDRFNTDGDDFQWEVLQGGPLLVEDGHAQLLDDSQPEVMTVNLEGALLWTNYVVYTRLQLTAVSWVGLMFYMTDVSNFYYAILDTATNTLTLAKFVGGTPGTIATFDFSTIAETLNPGEWVGLRVQAVTVGGTTELKVWVDGALRIDTTDTDLSAGTIGLAHDSGCTLQCDEVEMFQLPLDEETVDINS